MYALIGLINFGAFCIRTARHAKESSVCLAFKVHHFTRRSCRKTRNEIMVVLITRAFGMCLSHSSLELTLKLLYSSVEAVNWFQEVKRLICWIMTVLYMYCMSRWLSQLIWWMETPKLISEHLGGTSYNLETLLVPSSLVYFLSRTLLFRVASHWVIADCTDCVSMTGLGLDLYW